MQFHDRLYELRKGSGLTQNDLAEKLDVSRQAVSRWEMGTAKPDIDNLVALSNVLGVTLDYLLKGEESLEIRPPEPDRVEPVAPVQQEKKTHNRIWWIIWAVSFAVILAVLFGDMYLNRDSMIMAIHPVTLAVQIVNLALGLGIVILLIRWLCKKGSK